MIIAFLLLLYLKFAKPFRNDYNNYLAELNQLFLALFYGECLVLGVYSYDEYADFRELLGVCASITIFTYMMIYFLAGVVIFFK